ncbi:MAG: hypothetical protein K940chlam7_00116 [Chlamydiae bacterium]|nr:hypothetical protein [Chlamydiota bacterium]
MTDRLAGLTPMKTPMNSVNKSPINELDSAILPLLSFYHGTEIDRNVK